MIQHIVESMSAHLAGIFDTILAILTIAFLILFLLALFIFIVRYICLQIAECLTLLERLETDRLPTYFEAIHIRDGEGPIIKAQT